MRRLLVSTILLCCGVNSQGEALDLDWLQGIPSAPQSSLGIGFGGDDADGWNRQLDVSLATPFSTRVDLSLGESHVQSQEAQLETFSRYLSLSSDPLEPLSLTLGYEAWGDEDALTIDSRWLGLTLNLGDFSFTIQPQRRDIRLQVLAWFQRYLPHVDLESRDIGFSMSYFAADGWTFSSSYFSYDYSKDVSRLNDDYRVIFFFPLDTLDLASGLDRRRFSLTLSRLLDDIDIGLDWTRSRSAVDGKDASVVTLTGEIPLSGSFRLNLQGGVQDVDYSEDQILFANLGLLFSW